MYRTNIDITENVRSALVDELNAALADTIDLHAQTKQAHWNVKGPNFIGLHQLFDSIATILNGFIDEIAERAVALGGTAIGTIGEVVGRTRLDPYPVDLTSGRHHVEALAASLGAYARISRMAIDKAGSLGDADTADLFTQISREIDKQLWLVEAHFQVDE